MTKTIDPRGKLFQHLDSLLAIKEGRTHPPVSIELDASWRCSHGCEFCHYAYTHTRGPLAGKQDKPKDAIDGGDLLNFDLAKNILRQVAEYGVKAVVWSGGGEPTLNPHFNDLVHCADAVGLEQGLYTHGGHIDDERAALLKSTLTWVYVSLDECDAEAFKATKGVNRFEAVLGGIRRLVDAPGDATITIGFMLHPKNYTQIYNMVQLGKRLGVDYVQFRPVVLYNQDDPGALVEDTSWINDAIPRLRQFANDSFVIADIERFEQYANWTTHTYKVCRWTALSTVISPNGKVWRCTNKREHPDALLGDLSVESFATLWERSGGVCSVNASCRVMCIGTAKNITLDEIMTPHPHANFI